MSVFKVAICQMRVQQSKAANIGRAVEMIERASSDGAGIAVLPEMFNCPYDNRLFGQYAEDIREGITSRAMAACARKNGIYIVAGSIPEKKDGKLFNTCILFNPKGEIDAVYRKAHLFEINVKGKISFRESDTLTAGNEIVVADTGFCTIGLAICYDLRFPELFRKIGLMGGRLVIVPAAFNMVTGPVHWEMLLRTRAIDNQVYIAAASPARDPGSSYVAYGHSMVVDPWGDIAVMAGWEENIITADVDMDFVDRIREELPVLKNRRDELY